MRLDDASGWAEEGEAEEDGGADRSTAEESSGDWAKPTFSLKSLSNVAHFMAVHFHPTAATTKPDPSRRSEKGTKSINPKCDQLETLLISRKDEIELRSAM